jgi:hypothetical protein
MVPGEASTTVAVLKDRIFRSGAPLPPGSHPPPFPFILEDVRPSVADQMGGLKVRGRRSRRGAQSSQGGRREGVWMKEREVLVGHAFAVEDGSD